MVDFKTTLAKLSQSPELRKKIFSMICLNSKMNETDDKLILQATSLINEEPKKASKNRIFTQLKYFCNSSRINDTDLV